IRGVNRLKSIGDHNLPILLRGETGVGKDVFARAIHAASSRARQNYVALNCAAMPESLIDAELFGYEAGAFTGARRDGSKGLIVQADGGTLFLDEIGDMPIALQTRLLRVLENREVWPIRSRETCGSSATRCGSPAARPRTASSRMPISICRRSAAAPPSRIPLRPNAPKSPKRCAAMAGASLMPRGRCMSAAPRSTARSSC